MDKLFDLNIEQVLEHWEPEHAVREIIANALDEQFLTKSKKSKCVIRKKVVYQRFWKRNSIFTLYPK